MDWLENHFTIIEGFPRLNWESINNTLIELSIDSNLNDVWSEIAFFWVKKIQSSLPTGYKIYSSNNFIILTSENHSYTQTLLDFLENTLKSILKILNGIASDDGYGKFVLLIFDNLDHYYSYISYFYPEEGEFASSSGVYLNKGYGHFVFPHQEIKSAKSIATHELCHALLDHLPLPLWLNEGITVTIEDMIMADKMTPMGRDMLKEHEKYWDEERIQDFWSGDSFSHPDEGQHLSYHLAQFLVQILSRELESFKMFLFEANYADGGESAAQTVYNNSLGYLVEGVLGNGNWAPRSKSNKIL